MGTEIDRLDVKIEAEASDANKQLDETVAKLKQILAPLNEIMNSKAFVQLKEQSKETAKSVERISKETKAAMQNVSASIEKASKPMQESAKKVSESLKEIQSRYKDLGKDFQFFGSTESAQKQIDKYSNALETAKLKKAELEATGKTEGQMYEYAIRDVQKYSNILESLKKQYIAGVPNSQYVDISEMTQKEFDEWLKTLPSVKAQAQNISDTIENIKNQAQEVSREFLGRWKGIEIPDLSVKTDLSTMTEKELDDWFSNLPSVKAQAEQAAQSIKESFEQIEVPLKEIDMTLANFAMKATNSFSEPKEESNNFAKTLEKLKDTVYGIQERFLEFKGRLENIFVSTGLKTYTSQYTELQNDINKTEKTLATLNAQLARSRETVKNFEKTTAYRKMQYDIKQATAELQRLRNEQDKLETSGSATKWNFKGLSEGLQNFKKSLQPLGNALKSLDKKITSFVKKLRSIIFPAKSARKSVDGFHKSLSGGLVTMLKYSLGIRSLYVLFNRMRSAITEGFQNLALYSDKVNSSISLLMNSVNQLKNSVTAMVAPILNAVAPALNYLIQLCIKATNAVNQLISALLGNDTWIRAKKLTQDYRDTLQGVKDDVEEVTRTILGFDQLNVLNGKNKTTASGTTDLLPEDMFETLPVESKFKDLADKIKGILSQFFAPLKEAWSREGKFVMDSWKYALDEIWALIKSIGSDFLEVWQQEKTIKIFEDILHIIGDIGLVVGNLAHNFREAWEENETGKKILEGIRDIIGVIVANIRHAADATVEWSANLDFTPLLTKVKEWVESLVPVFDNLSGIVTDFYEKVLLPLGKWTIEKGLPDLLQVFIDFNEKVDWEALRASLEEFWKHLEPFAETVGEGLILFIDRVSNALADFVNSEAFDNFLTSVENWMDSVDAEDVADAIQTLITAFVALKTAMLGLQAIIGAFNFAGTLSQIALALKAISGGAGAEAAIAGTGAAAGTATAPLLAVVAALTALVAGLGYVFATNEEVRQSFDNAVNSIKEGLQPAIEFISGTVLPNLQAGWERLVEVLTPLGDFLKGVFTSIWQDMINPALTYIGENVLPKVAEAFENLWNNVLVPLGSFLADVLEPIIQIVADVLSMLWENVVVPLASAIGNVLAKAFEGLCEILNQTVVPIVKAVIGVFQFLWDNVLSPIVDFLRDTLKPIFEKVFAAIKEQIDALSKVLGGLIDFITGVFSGNWEKAWNGIKDIFSGIVDGIIGLLPKIPESFFNAFNTAKEKVIGVVEELYNSIVGWVSQMIEKIEGVISKAKEAIGLGSSSSSSSSSGLRKSYSTSSSKYSISIPKINVPKINVNIPKYATGGFPEDGLFMANHGELLGKFANGKTAVANNEQIISGIKQGVFEAVMSAMQVNSGNTGNDRPIYITIKTENDEVLARAVTRGQEKIDRRYKPTMT